MSARARFPPANAQANPQHQASHRAEAHRLELLNRRMETPDFLNEEAPANPAELDAVCPLGPPDAASISVPGSSGDGFTPQSPGAKRIQLLRPIRKVAKTDTGPPEFGTGDAGIAEIALRVGRTA